MQDIRDVPGFSIFGYGRPPPSEMFGTALGEADTANSLHEGSILLCQTDEKQRMSHVLVRVARYFTENSHVVRTLPYSLFL